MNYIIPNGWAFVQQIVRWVSNGYHFAVVGVVRESIPDADLLRIDNKIITAYEANKTPMQRSRVRLRGGAGVVYLRCGREYIILATEGRNPVHVREKLTDLRRKAIEIHHHNIRVQVVQGKNTPTEKGVQVRPAVEDWSLITDHFTANAGKWTIPEVIGERQRRVIGRYQSWSGVRRADAQLQEIVHRVRRKAGAARVPFPEFPRMRQIKTDAPAGMVAADGSLD